MLRKTCLKRFVPKRSFFHRWFARAARRVSRALPAPARSSLPLRSAPCLCATGARRPFEKGGRKLYSLAIAVNAGEKFYFSLRHHSRSACACYAPGVARQSVYFSLTGRIIYRYLSPSSGTIFIGLSGPPISISTSSESIAWSASSTNLLLNPISTGSPSMMACTLS